MIIPILEQIAEGNTLTPEHSRQVMNEILLGNVDPFHISALLYGLRVRGERSSELVAFAEALRAAAVHVDVDVDGAVDLCGTGGDRSGTFNVSTTAMFIVAGAGIPVLKHGNRSISSKSGSADVLDFLGANTALVKHQVENVFNATKMAFMFAPNFHPALKYVMPVRKSLGIRTFFNLMGPVLNPAKVRRQIVGTYSLEAARNVAEILMGTGTESALVFHSFDGMDELSVCDKAHCFHISKKGIRVFELNPEEYGFPLAQHSDIKGGEKEENAHILTSILDGTETGAKRDIAVLNAGAAIWISGKAEDLRQGIQMAKSSVESGAALEKLHLFITETSGQQ